MKNNLINYTLHLADNALILSHRNSEWCGHGPVLEQDIAITNIALDLLGQARLFYQYAATLMNQENNVNNATPELMNEDKLAFLRIEREYKNCILAEQPNGDWAQTILRQFFFSAFQFVQLQQLKNSNDEQLAAIAAKSLKEVTYHLRWSSEWVIRLGDGTDESHQRMLQAIAQLQRYTHELFIPAEYEKMAAAEGYGVDVSKLKDEWNETVKKVFDEATLSSALPFKQTWVGLDGKNGLHSEHMGYILTEMQYLQRTYPNSEW